MKPPTKLDEILEAMWLAISLNDHRRGEFRPFLRRKWRAILKKHLIDQTRIILHVGRDHFLVSSDSRPGEFHSIDTHDIVCSCEAHTLGGKFCKHLKTMQQLDEKGLLPKRYVH